MRLAEQIKEYVKCPQTGSHHYGRWGLALNSADRMLVDRLCDQCMIFEDAADKFHKENIDLKEENYLLKLFIKQMDPGLVSIGVKDKKIELPTIKSIKNSIKEMLNKN